MASLTPGYTFQTNESLTVAHVHQLVDNAYLVNVDGTDLTSTVRVPFVATPGSPQSGDVRVGSDGRLEFYYGAAWNTQPPDLLQLTLTNKSGSNLILGDVVVVDHTNAASFTIASTNPAADVIGVLAADINNNASGLVNVRGECLVRVAVGGGGQPAGTPIRGPNGTSGTAALKVAAQGSTTVRSDTFGVLMVATAIVGTTDLVTCYIWH